MQKSTNKKSTNKKISIKGILPKQKTLTDSSSRIKKQDSTISNIRQKKSSNSSSSSHPTIKSLVKNITNTKNNNFDTPYQLPSERKYGKPNYKSENSKKISDKNREELEKALVDISAIKPINKRNDKPTVLNKQPIICSLEGGIVKTGKSGCPCCPF